MYYFQIVNGKFVHSSHIRNILNDILLNVQQYEINNLLSLHENNFFQKRFKLTDEKYIRVRLHYKE